MCHSFLAPFDEGVTAQDVMEAWSQTEDVTDVGCPTLRLLLIDFRGKKLFFLSDLVTTYNSISSQDIDVSAILQIEFP